MTIDQQKLNSHSEVTGSHEYHIVNAPGGVSARKGPGASFPVVHSVANNSAIDIACQVHGEAMAATSGTGWLTVPLSATSIATPPDSTTSVRRSRSARTRHNPRRSGLPSKAM